jgi:hypothetical protein
LEQADRGGQRLVVVERLAGALQLVLDVLGEAADQVAVVGDDLRLHRAAEHGVGIVGEQERGRPPDQEHAESQMIRPETVHGDELVGELAGRRADASAYSATPRRLGQGTE